MQITFRMPGISSRLTVRDLNSCSGEMNHITRGSNNCPGNGYVYNDVNEHHYYNLYNSQAILGKPKFFNPNCMKRAERM